MRDHPFVQVSLHETPAPQSAVQSGSSSPHIVGGVASSHQEFSPHPPPYSRRTRKESESPQPIASGEQHRICARVSYVGDGIRPAVVSEPWNGEQAMRHDVHSNVQYMDLEHNSYHPSGFETNMSTSTQFLGPHCHFYDHSLEPIEEPWHMGVDGHPSNYVPGQLYNPSSWSCDNQRATQEGPEASMPVAAPSPIPPNEPTGGEGGVPQQPEPQSILYNPFENGNEPCYTRVETPDGVVYQHATAGRILKVGDGKTRWHRLREENQQTHNSNPWGRWGTKAEWDDAWWMATSKTSQSGLEELLQTERYRSSPPKFKTVKNLFDIIDNELEPFGGPEWHTQEIVLPEAPKDRHFLFYQDIEKVGDHLFGSPQFVGKMSYAPVVKIGTDGQRQYDQVNTGDIWNHRQTQLEPGTTYGAGIFMSDATQLSTFSGDVSAHGLYMSLGNIDKAVRDDFSKGAWALVAQIPKSNWEHTFASMPPMSKERRSTLTHLLNRRLFHRCMEIITRPLRRTKPHEALDPEGNIRLVQYDLCIYGADLEEQALIAGISRNSCPHCDAKGNQLGDPKCQHPRSSAAIKIRIRQILSNFHRAYKRYPDPWEFLTEGKKFDLNGVQKPFWFQLPHIDICQALSPDVLHGVHKLFFDHFHKWNVNGLGADEFDARLQAQIPAAGEKMFSSGVSKFKQLSGKDHRALERVHLGIVSHAPQRDNGGGGSQKLTKATRSVMDCIFIAQLPVQTESTLKAYEKSHAAFEANKNIWVDNKSKTGAKGKLIETWAIPKSHIIRHIPDHVRLKGTTDNYNTETMERLHKPMLKDPYRASNRKGWQRQVIRSLVRHARMRGYRDFLEWNAQEDKREREALARLPFVGQDWGTDDEGSSYVEDEQHSEAETNSEVDEEEREEESEIRSEVDSSESGGFGEDERLADEPMDYEPTYDAGSQVGQGVQSVYDDGEDVWFRAEGVRLEGRQDTGVNVASDRRNPGELGERWERTEATQGLDAFGNKNVYDGTNQPVYPGDGTHEGDTEMIDQECQFPITEVPLCCVSRRPKKGKETIAQVQADHNIPNLARHMGKHPYTLSLLITVNEATRINIWDSLRIRVPVSVFHPHEQIQRIYGQSLSANQQARSDTVFYVPTKSPGVRTPEWESLHDYSVGRVVLIFSLAPSRQVPEPRLMACVQRFTGIPKSPGGVSGLYAIEKSKQRGSPRYEVIAASQIARLCPLSPVIEGNARRGVKGYASLDYYNKFYINKYRTPRDFSFLHWM